MSERITVTFVEDHDLTREVWAHRLRADAGIHLLGAYANAEAALPAMLAQPPQVALVDWKLPGLNGLQLIECLKARHPGVRAVLVTAHDLDELPLGALFAGVDACLAKPEDSHAILPRLRDVLAGHCVFSARLLRRLAAQLRERLECCGPGLAAKLSGQERQVLEMLAAGLTGKEVAARLGVGYSTMDTLRQRAYVKLQVHSLSEAVCRLRGVPPLFTGPV